MVRGVGKWQFITLIVCRKLFSNIKMICMKETGQFLFQRLEILQDNLNRCNFEYTVVKWEI